MWFKSVFLKTLRDYRVAILGWGIGMGLVIVSPMVSVGELVKTPEGKARLQAAVNEYWPYLPKFFGGSKSKNNEIFRKWKIKQRTNDEMREDFIKRATEVAAKYGLTLPEVRQAA